MQLCVRGPTAKRFHYFGKTRYAFRHTGLQQFLYQFRAGESPWILLKPAQYTYFRKYIGWGEMLSIGRKKKNRSTVFQGNLLPLIQKTEKVFGNFCWEHYYLIFEYIPVWNEKWIFVCVCETPNLFFTCRQKWNIHHYSTCSYSTEMFVYESILYILQMVQCSGLRIFLLILASSHTQEPAIPPNHSCWNSGWVFSSW